jgi:YHS domain-containing protein
MRYWFASAHDRALFLENPGRFDGSGSGGPETVPEAQVVQGSTDEASASASPWSHPRIKAEEVKRGPGKGERDILLGSLPAISGYCPVTLRNEGTWIRGRYEHRVELDDLMYLTAGPKERDALRADPAKYAAALGGDCVVSFINQGERIRGSVYHAFEYEDRLFLFVDAERKAAFKASPDRYASADWAANGVCVVTQLEQERATSGLADQTAWHRGKLYRFAGAEEKQKFLADPEKYAPR